jgi:hypothetical protein
MVSGCGGIRCRAASRHCPTLVRERKFMPFEQTWYESDKGQFNKDIKQRRQSFVLTPIFEILN